MPLDNAKVWCDGVVWISGNVLFSHGEVYYAVVAVSFGPVMVYWRNVQ